MENLQLVKVVAVLNVQEKFAEMMDAEEVVDYVLV